MRFLVLVLSLGTLVLFGYALAGMGGYLMGKGRPGYILWGLSCGAASGAAAIFLWRRNLSAFFYEDKDEDRN